ncbi:ParB N-terminal domain-containing protein [Nocardia flavorosea]|uniref:ParB N-terminal domain-containing protein n=1 Tax=Nocardia flavorosea TaxID=53429 RepID=A0A846YM74_9NOCA|nr:ParB N-terminal domain-containing protein [Nocardia flavorosea]NKY60776.1 ParB N-terminal domain-containing protein [Nocardia flavorosea]
MSGIELWTVKHIINNVETGDGWSWSDEAARLWELEPERMKALKADLREHGIRAPIEVARTVDGRLRMWDGHHRVIVAAELRLPTIPVHLNQEKNMDGLPEFYRRASMFGGGQLPPETGAGADPINPNYYCFPNGAEAIDITQWLSACGSQAAQYVIRATRIDGKVKGDPIEDLTKAIWFLEREVSRLKSLEAAA